MQLATDEWERRGLAGNTETFRADLAQIRHTRLAYDLDTHTQGISAIGFAFEDHLGDLHAISVPVPTTRFDEVRPRVEAALLKTAGHIDKMMSRD